MHIYTMFRKNTHWHCILYRSE